jgi:peptidoglycan/LPS O-acetylase OafA/YrhL
LDSIDLLRAIAALAVTALHAFHHGSWPRIHDTHDLTFYLLFPVSFGGAGVYLFFVISGFCIHMRWAKATAEGKPPHNDFVGFWKRRLRRLYPAYAVALVIGVLISVENGATGWAFIGDIGSHTVLLHNFHPDTLYSINPVFWTLAIEEQLYLLYFLLLWLRRRYGWGTILGLCIGVRVAWQALGWFAARSGVTLVISESAQATWFIWVLGALAVENFFGIVQLPRWTRSLWLAGAAAVATATLSYADHLYGSKSLHLLALTFEQPGWALASFITLNAVVSRERWLHAHRRHWALAPWLWIGLASYSLYLFHMYVLSELDVWYAAGIGAALVAAAIGFVLLERPFIAKRS